MGCRIQTEYLYWVFAWKGSFHSIWISPRGQLWADREIVPSISAFLWERSNFSAKVDLIYWRTSGIRIESKSFQCDNSVVGIPLADGTIQIYSHRNLYISKLPEPTPHSKFLVPCHFFVNEPIQRSACHQINKHLLDGVNRWTLLTILRSTELSWKTHWCQTRQTGV